MNTKQRVRFGLIFGFIAWGLSLGIRFDAAWDALLMFLFSFIIYYYGE